jgi:hypothetical protein
MTHDKLFFLVFKNDDIKEEGVFIFGLSECVCVVCVGVCVCVCVLCVCAVCIQYVFINKFLHNTKFLTKRSLSPKMSTVGTIPFK